MLINNLKLNSEHQRLLKSELEHKLALITSSDDLQEADEELASINGFTQALFFARIIEEDDWLALRQYILSVYSEKVLSLG